MSEPVTPIEAYKAIIAKLIGETRALGAGSRIANSEFSPGRLAECAVS